MDGLTIESMDAYVRISDRLGTGGQPAPVHFAALAAAGYQVVINLAMPSSEGALPDEGRLVTLHGMVYVHLPVPWDAPTTVHLTRFFGLMDVFAGAKVFVHCAKNMRVSAFVFLYRVCREGVPQAVAEADLHRVWQPYGVWQELVDDALRDPALRGADL